MKRLKNKFPKKILAMVSLSSTILGTNLTEVNSEELKGLYFTGNIGTSSFTSADWKAEVNGLDHKGDLKFDDGTGWELGLGYDFGRVRTELSYGNSNNEIKSISAKINEGTLMGTSVESSASGDLKIKNILINGYLDFPLGEQKKLTPYLGAGIGGSKLDIDNITVAGEELESASTWLFGYQAKLGLSYLLNNNVNIFGEGIYSAFSDLGVAGEKYGLGSNSDINYRAGFRLRF